MSKNYFMRCVMCNHFCQWTKSTEKQYPLKSLKISNELWFHSQGWQRDFLLLWNTHTSSTAHTACNSTSTRRNNLLPCCFLIIYINLIRKMHTNKVSNCLHQFHTSLCLVNGPHSCSIANCQWPSQLQCCKLSMALRAAALQIACDRDRAELLTKCLSSCSAGECVILLLWQFRPDFHVGHTIHKSVLSCCMCCHILSPSHMSCVFGADHTLSDTGFKEHCPTKFCSEIKSPGFLQVINYDITMQASIFAYPW